MQNLYSRLITVSPPQMGQGRDVFQKIAIAAAYRPGRSHAYCGFASGVTQADRREKPRARLQQRFPARCSLARRAMCREGTSAARPMFAKSSPHIPQIREALRRGPPPGRGRDSITSPNHGASGAPYQYLAACCHNAASLAASLQLPCRAASIRRCRGGATVELRCSAPSPRAITRTTRASR
jgi:hypothetical protein